MTRRSGLDNAGKTTIVKRINGEDISTVSPTLGFNIKTMEYNGSAEAPASARCISWHKQLAAKALPQQFKYR